MRILLFTVFLLFSVFSYAHGDEAILNYGLGVSNSAEKSIAETKAFYGAYRKMLTPSFYWESKAGYWGDGSSDVTRKSSAFGFSGLGALVDLHPIEVYSGWSAGMITNTDRYLGGNFPQFNLTTGFTIRDNKGAGVGFSYNHVSSAGIFRQNVGRDFVMTGISFRY